MRRIAYCLIIPMMVGSSLGFGAVHLQAHEPSPKKAQLLIPVGKEDRLIKLLSKKTQNECSDQSGFQGCTAGCNQQFNIAVTYCNQIPTSNSVCMATAAHNLSLCVGMCARDYCS